MKTLIACSLLLAGTLAAAYTPFYSDTLTTLRPNWYQNPSGGVQVTSAGLTAPSASGGALIYSGAVPAEYQVATRLTLTQSGGTYIQYLRASADARSGPTPAGSFLSLEVSNVIINGSTGIGLLDIKKYLGGSMTLLSQVWVPLKNGGVLRTSIRNDGYLQVDMDGKYITSLIDNSLPAFQPGVGAYGTPAGNSISLVQFGPFDRVPPNALLPQDVGVSAFPNKVELQWPGVADDPAGIGVMWYEIYRNGVFIALNRVDTSFTDAAVQPDTQYSYLIRAWDYHNNFAPSSTISVRTPPAGSIDPRQTGVRPLGSYWGSLGEQIDTRSGNLNYSLPILTAMGRNGFAATFALSHNSQMWRSDPGGTWKLGRDSGFGLGWRLLAGSITPYWSDYYNIHHYIYTDSSGAEYRLDVNTNDMWTSREGIYVEYDAIARRLYFPSGAYWQMDAASSGNEEDTGTLYPTRMQDSNGNYLTINYQTGMGAIWENSSSRITQITDVRRPAGQTFTYQFTYGTSYNGQSFPGGMPHLLSIQNTIASGENWTFGYEPSRTIHSPFAGNPQYGVSAILSQAGKTGLGVQHSFQYEPAAGGYTGELNKVILPLGGYLRWTYTVTGYAGSRVQREVSMRYLSADGTAGAEKAYTVAADTLQNPVTRLYRVIVDPDAGAETPQKLWVFDAASARPIIYAERRGWTYTGCMRNEYAWLWIARATPMSPLS